MKFRKTKIFIKIISFVLIFVLLFTFVQDILIKKSPVDVQLIPQFYNERENSLDAVYIGSSNCFTYWNSAAAFEEYGICVYPYSCNSQSFFAAKHIIKEVRKTQPQSKFIVNINSITDDVVSVDSMHYLLDVMPFSLNKLDLIDHLSDIGGYSAKDRMEYYLPIIRFHSRISELEYEDFEVELDGLKGSTTYYPYLNISKDVSKSFVTTKEKTELSQQTVDYVNGLLDYCDQENVEVIFVTVPQAKGKKSRNRRYNALNEIIKNRGYTALDLTEKCEEIGIDMSVDFYNGGHTNIHGSFKYTHYLSEYLIEKYGFEDKRNNPDYSDWQTTKDKYYGIADSKILDFEWDVNNRDYSLKQPSFKISANSESIVVSWNKINGADGYAVYRKKGFSGTWEQIGISADITLRDSNVETKTDYYYTVVPFKEEGGKRYYGNYKYNGIKVKN